jgi:hypothetical protein
MLRMLEHGARTTEGSEETVAQREQALERRRHLNEKAEALISRIRTYPGCTRFLLPAAFGTLFRHLPDGFVVILNASKLAHHALLLHRATGLVANLEIELPSRGLTWTMLRERLPRDMGSEPEQEHGNDIRAMRLDNGRVSSFQEVLSQLWTTMVQPVIQKLGLKVRIK